MEGTLQGIVACLIVDRGSTVCLQRVGYIPAVPAECVEESTCITRDSSDRCVCGIVHERLSSL
eukprot:202092-Alexandrium_andersonii.AAC.1